MRLREWPEFVRLLNKNEKWSGAFALGPVYATSYEIASRWGPPTAQPPESANKVISADALVSGLFLKRNFSQEVHSSLLTWNRMKHLINYSQGLPNAVVAVKEARVAWENLMDSFVKEQNGDLNNSSVQKMKEKLCPHFLNKMNATEFADSGYKLRIPCGLIQGSSITVIGIPNGLLGDFRIDLTGESLPGEPDPPIILHYNVRLQGDKITDDPVIVQNTWTAADEWGEEERCPSPIPGDIKKVDELNQCNELVGNNDARKAMESGSPSISLRSSVARNRSGSSQHFPFKQGYLSVMTLRVGEEGIQMTVDGKHITSFAFRESLEPWHVSEVRISGDLELISVLASGLPTSEGLDDVVDLTALKSAPLQRHQSLDLFVGVFSTANNFRRRMAVRRAWMQYPNVKNGTVAVRFFVGLHKNQMVNEELWNEVQTYGDIQLMPFVEYYSLITWKTIAICIFGTQVVSAKYVMKTDDDAFVRVDEVLASLNRSNVSHGLLYGLINTDAHPHRSTDSKWYISPEEWPESTYPPWAHGPGYVVSHDIARAIAKRNKGRLKMFKLEDVAMGIWIAELKKDGLEVTYINEQRVYNEGCQDGYVVAHYQSPREMLCLWQKLQEGNAANCCVDQ
ncbi:beta-1,3-galactosyltransferase GALT1-like [Pistacia vera]|uniref:beta-1,3-galactosyltransferase GALT1-like n=1 Tax=Pistacia vera TaxID=55513 RepID=UPI001262F834|nr:beta-1,3-galactosyltransferase GALT1-like [Pistacia vera]